MILKAVPTGSMIWGEPMTPALKTLILMHPQEKKEPLATAPLIASVLPEARVRTGLSWPNLSVAWSGSKKPLDASLENARWGVFYLGSKTEWSSLAAAPGIEITSGKLVILEKKKVSSMPREAARALEGIVLLDGSWAEVKKLWWRNAWLLKLKRLVWVGKVPSLYGSKRREPRNECVSTLEALAYAIAALQADDPSAARLLDAFRLMLRDR